jgi:hypothetical protein
MLLSCMVAASHNDVGLIRKWKHADDKFVYSRIHTLVYKWLKVTSVKSNVEETVKNCWQNRKPHSTACANLNARS